MKFIVLFALFALAAARPNRPDIPRPPRPSEDKLQIIRDKIAKIREILQNRPSSPIHIGAEPIEFDPTEVAATPASSPLVQIIVNVQGSDSVTSPVIVDGIDHPTPVDFVEDAEEAEIEPSPVIVVEEAEDSYIEPTPVVIVEEAEDSYIKPTPVIIVEEAENSEVDPEQVIVVDNPYEELEPIDVVPIIAAPAVMAPDVLN